MKRGTPRHPKVDELASLLKIPRWGAVGILEMLWHFTAEFAHSGDVGKFADDAIAKALCYDGASTMLVSCLIRARWLDRCTCHRLRVHDWPEHADQTVKRVLDKRHQRFISCYDDPSTMLAPCYDETSQPSPSPSPIPIPVPIAAAPSNGASTSTQHFKKPSLEELKLHCAKAGLPDSEAERFWHFYESNGWRVGRNPMRSWQSAVINWRKNYQTRGHRNFASNMDGEIAP